MTREHTATVDTQRASGPDVELLDVERVAEILGIDVDLLLHWQENGSGPAASVRLARRRLYRRSDVESWARDHAPAGSVECQPWCTFHGQHPRVIFRADQYCLGEPLRVDLTLEKPLDESRYDSEARRFVPGPDYLEAFAYQAPDAQAQVRVSRSGGPELRFTPDEFRQLIEVGQLILGQIGAAR